jgi:PKD repeat protein
LSAAVPVTIQVTGTVVEPPAQPSTISGLQATYDGPIQRGDKISFVASVKTGSDVQFAWDFGDGATAEGATPSHIYAASGEYSVTVTASNSLGSEATTIQVTVLPVASTQQQLFTPFIVR